MVPFPRRPPHSFSGSWLFGGVEQRWGYAAEGDLDGRQRGLGVEPGGIDDGTISGVDPGAPVRAEAVGDLTEGDGGPERLFAAVVGRWDISVFEEDEEFRSPRLDLALQCGAGLQRDREGDELIEPALGLGAMGLQCRVGQVRSSPADPDRPPQMVPEFRRQGLVTCIDGVLDVA